jgi:LmbE family N-acetylglucosaminyl deacetylase
VTNGNAGHQSIPRKELEQIRRIESAEAGKTAGVEYEVLDIDDGSLTPSLENRDKVMRVIRKFRPDVIFTHRACDYHPDHRNTAALVQDCSFLATVPHILPEVLPLEQMPVLFYCYDRFSKPAPVNADIIADITGTIEDKVKTMSCHKSQYFDFLLWIPRADNRDLLSAPMEERVKALSRRVHEQAAMLAEKHRDRAAQLLGVQAAAGMKYAEIFEFSELGSTPSKELLHSAFGITGDCLIC